jgi:hypothetical protein
MDGEIHQNRKLMMGDDLLAWQEPTVKKWHSVEQPVKVPGDVADGSDGEICQN